MGTIIKNAKIVNEGKIFESDVLIKNKIISKIDSTISAKHHTIYDAQGSYMIPGVIDDQVHFREPGLTHKANIYTESRAAVAGGITSYMEMPNTNPQTLTKDLLNDKILIGENNSLANFSFFFGASNDNLDEVLKVDFKTCPGLKIFMGSSTGNMLVDNFTTLNNIFSKCEGLIATHCEDEQTIRNNISLAKKKFGQNIPFDHHPIIRSREACYKSSELAVGLAKKYNTRLHVLHISTKEELELFSNQIPLEEKRITSEVCIHHLTFIDSDYKKLGPWIKWNPAVKTKNDREALWEGLLNDHLDIIASDHAPHTLDEKAQEYPNSPSGTPGVQTMVPVMLNHVHEGRLSLERLVELWSYGPERIHKIHNKGRIAKGYDADFTIVDLNKKTTITNTQQKSKTGWTPYDGMQVTGWPYATIIRGHIVMRDDELLSPIGKPVLFKETVS